MEELKDCCSIAAGGTRSYLAYGIGSEILPRLEKRENYREPLDKNFIADFFDSQRLLVGATVS